MNDLHRQNISNNNKVFTHSIAIASGMLFGTTATWMGRKVVNMTGLSAQLDKIPENIILKTLQAANIIARPLKEIHRFTTENFPISERLFSILLAPILEEAVYRFGLQEGIKLALTQVGCSPSLVDFISISMTSLAFGIAHDNSLGERFSTTALCGMLFGLIQKNFGFSEAVASHSVYNITVHLISGVANAIK